MPSLLAAACPWALAIALLVLSTTDTSSAITAAGTRVLAVYLLVWGFVFLVSKNRLRDNVLRCSLFSAGGGLTLLALEVPAALRLADYRDVLATRPPQGWLNPDNRLDRELLYVHWPRQRLAGSRLGGDLASVCPPTMRQRYTWDITFDANGFRNAAELSRADIAVIGDSFVEGVVIPADHLLTTVLARETAAKVANLGQSGYGPQQEFAVLRRFALPLGPRTVVWVFFEGNDLSDVDRYRHAYDNWDAIQADNDGFRHRSFTRNVLFKLDEALASPLHHPADVPPAHLRHGQFVRPDGRRPVAMCFAWEPRPLSSGDERALAEVGQIFRETSELCDARGIRLVVAFAPEAFRVHGRFCRFDPASPLTSARPNDLPDRVRSLLHGISPGIGFVDLTPDLIEAAKHGTLVYLPDDTHWTSDGHATAARTLGRYLNATQASRVGARAAATISERRRGGARDEQVFSHDTFSGPGDPPPH